MKWNENLMEDKYCKIFKKKKKFTVFFFFFYVNCTWKIQFTHPMDVKLTSPEQFFAEKIAEVVAGASIIIGRLLWIWSCADICKIFSPTFDQMSSVSMFVFYMLNPASYSFPRSLIPWQFSGHLQSSSQLLYSALAQIFEVWTIELGHPSHSSYNSRKQASCILVFNFLLHCIGCIMY